ncbi:Uncharacterised protein [Raoultella ornithinolytica]|nr:Uncharacterised protein [Raoultella ornithinolytica]
MSGKPGLQAAEGSPGADADDDGVDIAVQLIVYFGRGSGGVRQRVGFVIELVNIERARGFLRQAARIILIIGGVALFTSERVRSTLAPRARRWKIFSRLILSGTTSVRA